LAIDKYRADVSCWWRLVGEEGRVIVHDLGPDAVGAMTRVDVSTVTEEPPSPIGLFPFHDCTCGIGSFVGRPPWELHTTGDELLHILAGSCVLTVRDGDGETRRELRAGELVIVPKGCWHRNDAPTGVTLFFITPRDGNHHSFADPAAA
jgi:mannose-6-phosphate isomerase-like protein (cupin superfamily)